MENNKNTKLSEQFLNRKITERGKIDSPNTQIHDRSMFWFGEETSIKSDVVKLV